MTARTFVVWVAVSGIIPSWTPAALGQQGYTFTKVLDLATQRPDGNGPFTVTSVATPAFDGRWVVFRDNGSADDASLQAIWSYDTTAAASPFHKLVDLHSVAPGGTATFSELHLSDTAPAVRGGTVIFLGRTAPGGVVREGVYSVPAAGGAITKVADYATADPSGGTFTLFDSAGLQAGGFSFDGATAAFHGQGSTLQVGIYAANASGGGLSLIADSAHPYAAAGASVGTFGSPVVSGLNVAMAGVAGSNPTTAYNGLYAGKAGNGGLVRELVNSNQQLPGGTNPAFHTRFDAPYMALEGTFLAFRASDAAAPSGSPLYGLYWTSLTSGGINRIADVNSTLPGLGKLQGVADHGVAVSQGNVLFRASDTTAGYPGNNALYLWNPSGGPARIVGTGDTLGAATVQVVHDPGPNALYGAGFVFLVEFGASGSFAIYHAAPAVVAGSVVNVSAASYAVGASLAPDTIVGAFGAGFADSAAAGAAPLPITLANVGVSVRDSAGIARAAQLYYAGPTQINYVAPSGTAAGAATVTVSKNGLTLATGTIQVGAVSPGLFTANADGRGAAAGGALKQPAAGAPTWQWTAACTAVPETCVTAPIDLGAATDQVSLILYGTGIRGYRTGIAATIAGVAAIPTVAPVTEAPGLDLVTIPIPHSLGGSGEVSVVLTVDGVAANTVLVNIQ